MVDQQSGDSNDGQNAGHPFATIAGGAAWVFGGRILKLAVLFFMQIIMARILGTSSYGGVVLASTVLGVGVLIGKLGLDTGLVRMIPHYEETPEKVRGVLRAGVRISVVSSILIALILIVFAPEIAIHVFRDPSLEILIRITALGLPFTVLKSMGISISKGARYAKTHVFVKQLLSPISRFLLISILVVLGFGAAGAVTGMVLAAIISGLVALVMAYRTFPIATSGETTPMYREALLFSLPLMFAAGMDFLISNTDTILIGIFLSSEQLGIYNVAFQLRNLGMFFFYPVTFLLPPVITRLQSLNRDEELEHVYQVTAKWMTLLTYPIFLLVVVFPDFIIRLSFGAQYVPAATPLQLLILPVMVTVLLGANGAALIALGHNRINLYVNTSAAALNLVLNLALITPFGIVGAAAASALSFIFRDIVYTLLLYRWHAVHPFSDAMLKPLFGATALAIANFGIFVTVLPSGRPWILGISTLYLGAYVLVMLRLGGVEPVDVRVFGQFEEAIGVEFTWFRNIVGHLSS